jgi:hypothetical protein
VWFLVAFGAVVVMILLTGWTALVLEAGEQAPGRKQEASPAANLERRIRRSRRPHEHFSTPPPSPLQGGSTLTG